MITIRVRAVAGVERCDGCGECLPVEDVEMEIHWENRERRGALRSVRWRFCQWCREVFKMQLEEKLR
jgi:hypothetical protein